MTVRDDQRNGFIISLVCMLVLMGVTVFIILTPSDFPLWLAQDIVTAGLVLGFTLWLILYFARWRRVNQRRQAAARGDQRLVPLAAAQPIPNKQAFTLLAGLQLKPRVLNRLGLYVLCAPLYLGAGFLANRPHGIGDIWFFGVAWLVFFPLGGLWRWLFGRQEMVITSDALWVNSYKIPWGEARLFAIRGQGKPGDPALTYELASATRVLTWPHLRPNRWWSLYKPPMPFEEYEQQMTRMLEFIVAVTSLPLYDVR
jgi:hypothetical protein